MTPQSTNSRQRRTSYTRNTARSNEQRRTNRARNLYRTSLSSISEESLAIQKKVAQDVEKTRRAQEEETKNSVILLRQQNETNNLLRELVSLIKQSNNRNPLRDISNQ